MGVPSSPQPQAVGETSSKINYASLLHANSSSQPVTKTTLKPVELVHGEPTIKFTMNEVAEFAKEEGLHQAVVIKFSYGHPDLKEIRNLIPKQLGVKGNCLVGWLAHRHFLIRFDQFDDFVIALSTQVRYLQFKGEEILYRVFPWSQWFNPKEETSIALSWISLPRLPPSMFARKALLSIASAVGKPLAIDKATEIRSRPSTARVKVLVDLLDKLPKRIRLSYLDEKTGKVSEQYQEVVYDALPLYCMVCKHQGHEASSCRHNPNSDVQEGLIQPDLEENKVEQLQGDARTYLNAKRAENQIPIPSPISTNLNDRKVVENSIVEVHNNATNLTDSSNVKSGQQLTQNKPELQVEKCSNKEDNIAENWTLVTHKKSSGSRSGSSTSRSNSPDHEKDDEKGNTENSHLCADLTTQNNFDPLLANEKLQSPTKEDGKLLSFTENVLAQEKQGESPTWADWIGEETRADLVDKGDDLGEEEAQISPPPLMSKLSPQAPEFVPKSMIVKVNESEVLESRLSDIDLGDDISDEDEEEMLDICFDKVAREANISPRHQRSGSKNIKKKTHGRRQSWDGKMTREFIPRHLPMRLAKQNHMTVSIGSNKRKN